MLEIIKTPAELAKSYIGQLEDINDFENSLIEEKVLVELDDICTKAAINNQRYFTSTNKAFALPVSFSYSEKVSYQEFQRLDFEAVFVTYSIIKIGRLIDNRSVRALCVTFDDSLLLPYFDRLDDSHLLHVPVLAISEMVNTD